MEKEKIGADEIRIEKLTDSHKEIICGIQSYEKELVDFLIEDALEQQKRKISVTYLWFSRKSNDLMAYVTISPDCVKLKGISKSLSQKFRDKGINYKSLPALKIGRLCVDDRYLKKGIGTLIIQFTIKIAASLSKQVGCRFLYLDAKRNDDPSKDVIHFYKNMGFEIYSEKERRKETPMYMDLWPILEELRDD